MKKPSWWKWLDVATFGAIAAATAGATIWAMSTGVRGEALALLWTVVAAFAFIYGRLVWLRKKFIDSWIWDSVWGLMIRGNGYHVSLNQIDSAMEYLAKGWGGEFGAQRVGSLLRGNVFWVIFSLTLDAQGDPMENVGPKEGYTKMRSFTIHVDYDKPDDALKSTSFEHEMGHQIQGHITGEWDEATHHARAKAAGLP